MSLLQIRIDATALKRLDAELVRWKSKIPMAIARGVNAAGDKTRTQVQRALQKHTGVVRYSSVTQRVRTARAFENGLAPKSGIGPTQPGNLRYMIIVSGKPSTKPDEFKVRVRRGPGGGVAINMWGVEHLFKRSFQVAGDTGFAGLRARLSADRLPLRGFRGPNMAKEAEKGEALQAFYTVSAGEAPAAVLKALVGVLSR
jgi:hypothetical protein